MKRKMLLVLMVMPAIAGKPSSLHAAEKPEISERDALVKQALELDQEATQLNTKADKQGETVVDLQKIYDDVRANPERAKELAGKVR